MTKHPVVMVMIGQIQYSTVCDKLTSKNSPHLQCSMRHWGVRAIRKVGRVSVTEYAKLIVDGLEWTAGATLNYHDLRKALAYLGVMKGLIFPTMASIPDASDIATDLPLIGCEDVEAAAECDKESMWK